MGSTTFSGPVTSTNGFVGSVTGNVTGNVTATTVSSTSGNFTNIDAGASGTAGSVDIFPATASKGKVAITAADAAGNTTTSITVAAQAAARTYTVPDAGASASFVMSTGTSTGISATSAELNAVAAVVAGTVSASKAIVVGANKNIDTLAIADGGLKLGSGAGTAVGATAAEINLNCDQSAYSETLTAAGDVTSALTARVHAFDTTLGAQTSTPAAPGAANYGVINVWTLTVRPGSDNHVMTLTNFRGGSAATSATFDAVGETLTAIGGPDNKWHIIGEDGVTLA